jgi:hypothetical protein
MALAHPLTVHGCGSVHWRSGPVWSGCGSIDGSWWWRRGSIRSWSWSVDWSRGIGWSWSMFEDGFTLVLDIGDVAVLGVGTVGHNLGTTVGKGNAVFAADNTVVILD